MGAELQDSWTLEILEYAKYHTGKGFRRSSVMPGATLDS